MAKPLYTLTPNFLSENESDDLVSLFKFSTVGFIQQQEKGNIYAPNSRIVDLSDLDRGHYIFERGISHFNAMKEKFELTELGWVSYNFLRYRVGGKFTKHTDTMKRDRDGANRQFSMTIQLSNTHEGGEFVIYKPGREEGKIVPLKKGSSVSFRSEILHEVRPVTEGTRYAFVLWFMTKPKQDSIRIT